MKHPKYFDTDEVTSKRMSRVKLKQGKEESLLAKRLWALGYRYRLNFKALPGSPDIAILKHRIAVFVDGEFWHGYQWEERKQKLKRNREYWIEKIEENMARDKRVDTELRIIGWIPIHFWAREINTNLDGCIRRIESITKD